MDVGALASRDILLLRACTDGQLVALFFGSDLGNTAARSSRVEFSEIRVNPCVRESFNRSHTESEYMYCKSRVGN